MPTSTDFQLDPIIEKKYRNWITIAGELHKNTVAKWAKRFMNRLKQKFPALTKDNLQCVYNYYKVNLSRMLPVLVPKEVHVSIKPENDQDTIDVGGKQFDNRRAAIILENKINQIINDNAFKYTVRAAVYDLLVSNIGVIVVGQETELDEREEVPEGTQNVMAEKAANGETIPGETPVMEKTVKAIKKPPRLVIKRESWKNVMLDSRATDYFFANRRYAVRVVRLPYDEAKVLYGDDVPVEVEQVDGDLGDLGGKMDEAKMVALYEVYDYTDGIKRTTFLGKAGKCVGQVELNYDELAIVKLNYLPDEVYPPSDMVYYESQVDESNFYRTASLNGISRGLARKILYESKALTDDAIDSLMSDEDMEPVPVDAKDKNIADKLQVWQNQSGNIDVANAQARIDADVQILANINSIRLGQTPDTTATTATLANNAFETQVSERSDIIKDWMAQIVERIIAVLKEISLEKEDLLIKRPDGTEDRITWSQPDIAFAAVKVEVDITADIPDDVKMRRLLDYIGFITQPQISAQLSADGKKIQMFEMVKEVSGYFLPDKNFDRFIVDDAGIINPDRENLIMLAGGSLDPLPQEDFKKHLEAHEAFRQHPAVVAAPRQIAMIVEEHIAKTMKTMNEQQALKKPEAQPEAMAGQLSGGALNAGT